MENGIVQRRKKVACFPLPPVGAAREPGQHMALAITPLIQGCLCRGRDGYTFALLLTQRSGFLGRNMTVVLIKILFR